MSNAGPITIKTLPLLKGADFGNTFSISRIVNVFLVYSYVQNTVCSEVLSFFFCILSYNAFPRVYNICVANVFFLDYSCIFLILLSQIIVTIKIRALSLNRT